MDVRSLCDAIIFDCDGVLVNSEQIVIEIELRLLAEAGLDYDRHTFVETFMGTADEHFYAELNNESLMRLGHPLPQEFQRRVKATVATALKKDLKAVKGVHRFADSRGGVKAVASSSSLPHLKEKLAMTGLQMLFDDHVYSADLVSRGKPHPDMFLYAGSRLGLASNRFLVIEDSVNGVLAAKAAGMLVAGFVGGGHCLPGHGENLKQAGAFTVFATFNALSV